MYPSAFAEKDILVWFKNYRYLLITLRCLIHVREGREADPSHAGHHGPLLLQVLHPDDQVILQLLAAEPALQTDWEPVAVQVTRV